MREIAKFVHKFDKEMKKLILSLLSLLGICCGCKAGDIKSVGPEEFCGMMQQDPAAVVLDVRTPEEYAEGHLDGAVLLNVADSTTFDKGVAGLDPSKHYYVYCRSGRRSMRACHIMRRHGLEAVNLDGGIIAWKREGLPVKK